MRPNVFASDDFSNSYKTTIGADFIMKVVTVDGVKYTVQIWDIAGQVRTKSAMTRNFFREAHGLIITYR